MKEVRWTKTAKLTLQETSDFITENWGTGANQNFIDQLDYRIAQLQRNPKLGPLFSAAGYRKLVIHKHTSLFYIDHTQFIKLLVIWDNRSNPDQLLKKFTEF